MDKPVIYTIVGPTASGKTALSCNIAELLQKKTSLEIEIISADSRQIYKSIPVSTAQPSADQLARFKHHFISELELYQEFSAGEFGREARNRINEIIGHGKIPLIVGGSGLYVHSLVFGLFDMDNSQYRDILKQQRQKLYDRINKYGLDHLIGELETIDPECLQKIRKNGITDRRIVRALEVYYTFGITMTELRSMKPVINFEPLMLGIYLSRDELYNRINLRTEQMLEKGMIEEIQKLRDMGFNYNKYNSLNTVGVREVFDYLDGKISYESMAELIKRNTRRFAKRQITWFSRYKVRWLKPDELINLKTLI